MKRALTLLEILLVIVIIGLIVPLAGFQISSFLKEHRFKSSAQVILDKFYFARALGRDLGCDMTLTLMFAEKGSKIFLESDIPLTTRELQRCDLEKELKEISSGEFNGRACEKITFHINQNGFVEPDGTLILHHAGKTLRIKISSRPEIIL